VDKRLRQKKFKGFAAILAVLYLFGVVQFDFLHSLVHSHQNAELHCVENENNPCHRSIYHADENHGCEHDNHLVAKVKDCLICKEAIQREHANNIFEFQPADKFINVCGSAPSSFYFSTFFLNGKSRAPPFSA